MAVIPTITGALSGLRTIGEAGPRPPRGCGASPPPCPPGQEPICMPSGKWRCVGRKPPPPPPGCSGSAPRCPHGASAQCVDGQWKCQAPPGGCIGDPLPCPSGQRPLCQNGKWTCTQACGPKPTYPCSNNQTWKCINGEWQCTGAGGPGGPGGGEGGFFDEELFKWFEGIVKNLLGRLEGPVPAPEMRAAIANLNKIVSTPLARLDVSDIDEAIRGLGKIQMTDVDKAIRELRGIEVPQTGQRPELQQAMQALERQLGGVGDIGAFREFVTGTRVPELRAEPFTETEEAARRVATFDQLEVDRQQAKRNVIEQMGGLGHTPTSGLVARALQNVDRQFDQERSRRETALHLEGINIRERRRSEADALMGQLAGFGLQEQQLTSGTAQALANLGISLDQLSLQEKQVVAQIQGMIGNLGLSQAQQEAAIQQIIGQLGLGKATLLSERELGARAQNIQALTGAGTLGGQLTGLQEARFPMMANIAALLPALARDNLQLALQLFGGFGGLQGVL